MQRKVFKIGHSAAVTLSQNVLKDMGLKVGDEVKIETDAAKKTIVITGGKRQKQLPLNLKLRMNL